MPWTSSGSVMNIDPYRTPEPPKAEPERLARGPSHEITITAVLLWILCVVRVGFALWRREAASLDTDLAWLLVMLMPIVVWKEIAAGRAR